jgi:glutathione S-transferase
MADYTLFCAPDTYAMSAHVVLEEVGADYDIHWVTLFAKPPDPAFLAASPHCRTPALTGPDGSVFETGAVALYLAEQYPKAGLVIPTGDPRRGKFLQWFHYLATTLQPDVLIQYHPEFYMQSQTGKQQLKAASTSRLQSVFQTLDAALSNGPYFFGDHPSVPDFILGMQTIWGVIFPSGIDEFPNLARHLDTLLGRPAVQRVLAQHKAEKTRRPGVPA